MNPVDAASLRSVIESERASSTLRTAVYRYRLIDETTGADLGPFVSLRLTFASGEPLARAGGPQLAVVNVVEPENENFRAYIVVRAVGADGTATPVPSL